MSDAVKLAERLQRMTPREAIRNAAFPPTLEELVEVLARAVLKLSKIVDGCFAADPSKWAIADNVHRLRQERDTLRDERDYWRQLCFESEDGIELTNEIKRLRAALEVADRRRDTEVNGLVAQNKALREALVRICDCPGEEWTHWRNIARDALKEQ